MDVFPENSCNVSKNHFIHGDMLFYEDRLRTFQTWPKQILPTKETLACSGFIYSGQNDSTNCFACNIKLKDWDRTDNPWTEHRKWSPNCIFLKMIGEPEKKLSGGFKFIPGQSQSGIEFGKQNTFVQTFKPTDSSLFVKRL